jgi:stage V sporulation protein SpoVS
MHETAFMGGFYFMDIQVLKVSKDSNINAVAEAIIERTVKCSIVHVDCIGVKATYVTVKSIIQATEFLVKNGYKFSLRPYYIKVNTTEDEMQPVFKTAIRWTLIAKKK